MFNMKITLRTKDGWSEPIECGAEAKMKDGIFLCPKCEGKLSMAPHGGVYCDNFHDAPTQKSNPAAAALGSIKSEKKAKASRENGKKGGRPRKIK